MATAVGIESVTLTVQCHSRQGFRRKGVPPVHAPFYDLLCFIVFLNLGMALGIFLQPGRLWINEVLLISPASE